MWKRNESEPAATSIESAPSQPAPAARPSSRPSQTATIGPSIVIHGDITGSEDLTIEGQVRGAIQLPQHNVTIGSKGRVEANIEGKRICVEGQVKGDLNGDEIVIRQSGKVEGNATAPRVTLENGCNFRGKIDMQPAPRANPSEKIDKRKPNASAGV